MTKFERALAAAALICGIARPAVGQITPTDLTTVTIEDLMNVQVTSASRKAQASGDVAAAVYVISRDDIRRSGMTTIPDLLRLAPGVDVAQVNANKWAVTIRGFNGVFANKLLVLVDGRTIYDRAFAGVGLDAGSAARRSIGSKSFAGPARPSGAPTRSWRDQHRHEVDQRDAGRAGACRCRRAGELGSVCATAGRWARHYRVYSQWSRRDETLIAQARAQRRRTARPRISRRLGGEALMQ